MKRILLCSMVVVCLIMAPVVGASVTNQHSTVANVPTKAAPAVPTATLAAPADVTDLNNGALVRGAPVVTMDEAVAKPVVASTDQAVCAPKKIEVAQRVLKGQVSPTATIKTPPASIKKKNASPTRDGALMALKVTVDRGAPAATMKVIIDNVAVKYPVASATATSTFALAQINRLDELAIPRHQTELRL